MHRLMGKQVVESYVYVCGALSVLCAQLDFIFAEYKEVRDVQSDRLDLYSNFLVSTTTQNATHTHLY